jgi:hypothetical protein
MTVSSFEEVSVEANLDIRDPIIVSVSDFKGKPRLDMRHYYETDEGEMSPTRKGVNVPLDDALELIEALVTAYNAATASNLSIAGKAE